RFLAARKPLVSVSSIGSSEGAAARSLEEGRGVRRGALRTARGEPNGFELLRSAGTAESGGL
ncbi:MAG: hypothetical protein ACK4N5_12285, partial [Myxococcales bacterium]